MCWFCTHIAAHTTSSFIYYLRLPSFCSMCCYPTISSTRHRSNITEFKGRFSLPSYILSKSCEIITQRKFPEHHSLVFIHHHYCGSMYSSSLLLYSNSELDTWMYYRKWCSKMAPMHSSWSCSPSAHAKNCFLSSWVTSSFLHMQISVLVPEPVSPSHKVWI